MKQESFLKGFLTIGIATVINLFVGFFTTPIITRLVDPVDYGQFSIFIMYTSLVIMVLCFGMDQSLVRFYYRSDELPYKRKLIAETFVLPIVVTLTFIICALILIKTGLISFEFNWFCTILLAINILLNVGLRFSTLLVRLNNNNKLYGRIQVLQKVTYVALALVFLTVFKANGVETLSLATVLAVLICVIICIYSQKRYIPKIKDLVTINNHDIKPLLKYGFPFVFSMGITSLFQSLDKLSLNYYRTYSEVGIYASAMTFVSLFNIVQTSFNTIWAPRSIEHYEKEPEDKQYYKTAFNLMSIVMFGIGVALILFKDIFALLLGEKYREAAFIMPFLIFHPIMYTISETTVCGIDFTKKSTLHVFIAGGACLTNFIGNTLLVPVLGCRGAAISTGISYIVFFLLRTLFAEKYYPIGFNLLKFSIITVLTTGYAAYNTFFRFGLLSILFALVCYIAIIVLYRETITWGIQYFKKNIMPSIRKRT